MVANIQNEEKKLRTLLTPEPSVLLEGNFLLVLRRWNSYTPALRTHDIDSVGGGYFLSWHGKGIVIDPGLDFIRNFRDAGLRIADIHAIVLTHSHLDHYADFEPLMTLLYEYNEERKDEAKREGKRKKRKRIHILANQGALRKCSGWLDILHKKKKRKMFETQIERIYALDPFVQTDAQPIPGTSVKLKPTKAYHNEIIAEQYSVGLIFELYGSLRSGMPEVTVGITGDTEWIEKEKIHTQYQNCELLVIHLGTVGEKELINGEYYRNHLGVLGTTRFLSDSICNYQLSIISEFGEELKPYRREVMTTLIDATQGQRPGDCIAGDVGTKVMLGRRSDDPNRKIKLMCEFAGCDNEAAYPYKDVYELNGVVRHYCDSHKPPTPAAATWLGYVVP